MDAYPVSDWYEPREEAVKIMNNAAPFELLVVHGTWCPDCEYMIPLLKKLLLQLPNVKVIDCPVDHSKVDKDGYTAKYDIHRIPAIVAIRDGKKLGAVIEYPNETIEEDLAKVL